MNKKLWFLTKISLQKKIKTKWFLVANIIFIILIIGLTNIDTIIKFFGGDFNEPTQILVLDYAGKYHEFEKNYLESSNYLPDYDEVTIKEYLNSYDEALKEVENENKKILLVIEPDEINYIKASIISNEGVGTITNTLIGNTLRTIRTSIALREYNITPDEFNDLNKPVETQNIILSEKNSENDVIVSTIMNVITLPLFMLIMFLVGMIGAEVNEEKTTKSMEIIISNVSPKTHFTSKIIASNIFVLIQGGILLIAALLGAIIRLFTSGGNLTNGLEKQITELTGMIDINSILSSLNIIIPILIIMIILTFIAYSLLAGVLASMTTNLEDFQQLQTPIMIISLAGFYLSMMAGMFKGSLFIRIMSYLPFISSLLAPTLYILGDISLIDLLISIILLIGTIYLLIKYGMRIYKVGILNYSGNNLWKKMFNALKEK